jgi:hypothetical protein
VTGVIGGPMTARGIFVLIAVVSVFTGVAFIAVDQQWVVAVLWLLVGVLAAVGAVLADRRQR